MLAIDTPSQFRKDLKRLQKRKYDLTELKAVMKMIQEEVDLPEEIYRAHKLRPTRDYLDCWECHIGGRNSDWLLIYKFYPTKNLVVFIRTGTHADLF
ncbi:type II toxin-antitoxin system YafQ family toxin [Planococcus sp. CP5-4]|uniref:type II toxin-antitoxin system YafQ family toxin n=1 Tax=unclassified Planococcus (in: firmicutes) TaxID=2662419 RepID=UPI001C236EE9|nr:MULTISPECIES: type II toxin-antitoxin system YafQ family toxin [unclassified Planococcus (in: firmicutes)]MBU9673892.1 type II toxin-antitoxin system YafQ family toxin [Planococcus sp. CP5-4_YE]MBV0909762.1 type II toxin-antitoxin system YafQ family toxin [Planococcus sp. CP5-4_UN]MBW6065246.1 type II toxin-antitoxin system YafQ family toxin [Planococcus sp. CP5-4]